MPREKKSRMVSMRITESQYDYLNNVAKRIRELTGFHVTRASIILKLMEYGYPYLNREFKMDDRNELEKQEQD